MRLGGPAPVSSWRSTFTPGWRWLSYAIAGSHSRWRSTRRSRRPRRGMRSRGSEAENGGTWDALFLSRGADVSATRPVFTGDTFLKEGCDPPEAVMLLQHPCALSLDP